MSLNIGTRDQLIVDLEEALALGEPSRLLVVFRVEGFNQFIARHGFAVTEALIAEVASSLPQASGALSFYYRPREDELCALVGGSLDGIEAGLFEVANAVYDRFGLDGVTLDFGTALLPQEARDPVAALALADGRMTGLEVEAARRQSTA
jgi:GGDEF domain-containing protein